MIAARPARLRRRVRRLPVAIPIAIAAAWALAVVAQAGGRSHLVDHDSISEGGPFWAALGLFAIAWSVMTLAMMLPSSLPLVRMFSSVSRAQPRHGRSLSAFVSGYLVVWTVFGIVALCADLVLHDIVDMLPFVADRPWLVPGLILVGAGAFQFTPLKDKCLDKCRHPGAFLLRHYRRGTRAAFDLGRRHGLFCLGCCWALMLVGFAAGFSSLWWMAALTALMVYEKTGRGGRRAVPVTGVVLLAWGALVLVQPAWLPQAVGGFGPGGSA